MATRRVARSGRVGVAVASVSACLLVAAVTGVDRLAAQSVAYPAEFVSIRQDGTGSLLGTSRNSAISYDGQVVAFDNQWFDSIEGVTIEDVYYRHRTDQVTARKPGNSSVNPEISGDGCVVVASNRFTSIVGGATSYTVTAYDQCQNVSMNVGSAPAFGTVPFRPATNRDGSRVVWSNGADLYYADRSGNSYGAVVRIDNPPGIGTLGRNVAVSADGNQIAFETGNAPIGFAQVPIYTNSVYVVDARSPTSFELVAVAPDGAPLQNTTNPSISGNGTLVTFQLRISDNANFVLLRDRENAQTRLIAAPATDAEISRDGRYVAFEATVGEVGDVFVARSTGPQPFENFEIDLVSYVDGDPATPTNGAAFSPDISEHGRWVTFDSWANLLLGYGSNFEDTNVYVRERRPVLSVDSISFGTVTDPVVAQSTVRNTGPSGWRITSIAATVDFEVVGHNCPSVLHPGGSCVVDVRFRASAIGAAAGQLFVRDDSYPGRELAAVGRLTGTVEEPPPPGVGLSITPNPVDFGTVPVGDPAPTQPATVRNTGETAVNILTVSIGGADAGDFSIVSNGCAGATLAPTATCGLVLGFTPGAAVGRSAALGVTGSGGASASARLIGTGQDGTTTTVPELFFPELSVSPEVAVGGQVVIVSGVGYPPASVVGVRLDGNPPLSITTDGVGGFAFQWLILEGTPQAVVPIDDVATPQYDAAAIDLQIVATPVRPQGVPALARTDRRFVSR